MTREYPESSHFYEIRTQPTVTLDNTAPSVTIDQASGQADPTTTSPIHFTVVFSETVSDFATGSGTTYNVAVSGMTTRGTVIASLAAGVAHDAATNARPLPRPPTTR